MLLKRDDLTFNSFVCHSGKGNAITTTTTAWKKKRTRNEVIPLQSQFTENLDYSNEIQTSAYAQEPLKNSFFDIEVVSPNNCIPSGRQHGINKDDFNNDCIYGRRRSFATLDATQALVATICYERGQTIVIKR